MFPSTGWTGPSTERRVLKSGVLEQHVGVTEATDAGPQRRPGVPHQIGGVTQPPARPAHVDSAALALSMAHHDRFTKRNAYSQISGGSIGRTTSVGAEVGLHPAPAPASAASAHRRLSLVSKRAATTSVANTAFLAPA